MGHASLVRFYNPFFVPNFVYDADIAKGEGAKLQAKMYFFSSRHDFDRRCQCELRLSPHCCHRAVATAYACDLSGGGFCAKH